MSEIKVCHLVHHLSGLPEYSDELCSTNKNKPLLSNDDVYAFYKKQTKLNFKAGNKHEYSNGGYNLLATLIENVADQPFSQFLEKNIFMPAAMKDTAIITYPSTVKNQAKSYSEWPFFEDIDFNTGNALYGEDGLYCSLNDIQAWIHALDSNLLISASMTEKVFSPVKDNLDNLVKYGYGWFFEDFYKHKMRLHTGGWVGFNTVISNIPNKNIWFVAFSNSHAISSWSAMEQMAKYYLDLEELK